MVASRRPMPYTRSPMKLPFVGAPGSYRLLTLFCLFFAAASAAQDAQSGDAALAERDLAELRDRLQQVERDLNRQSQQRDRTQRDLRAAERSEAEVRRKLEKIDVELTATRDRLGELQLRADETRAELSSHVASLEQELRRAYVLGRDDWLRAVLSQQDPVAIGRQLVYSGYLARERNALAEVVRADLDALDATRALLNEENQRLAGIQARESQRLAELEVLRKDRSAALTRINQGIATRSEKLDKLRAEMAELQTLVDELTRALTALPIGDAEPFAKARGRLEWPADGPVTQRFGQARADGRLRWEGVLLAAAAGEDVRAIHHGRVIYADWLQGMGLLVIIEHGDGYLSLYGHNQDIVADIGEWVAPGDVIAHVGDSGGRATPGLYFEIRKDGKPTDPGDWIRQ